MRNFSFSQQIKRNVELKSSPFQQYEGANKIVARVKEGRVKKG